MCLLASCEKPAPIARDVPKVPSAPETNLILAASQLALAKSHLTAEAPEKAIPYLEAAITNGSPTEAKILLAESLASARFTVPVTRFSHPYPVTTFVRSDTSLFAAIAGPHPTVVRWDLEKKPRAAAVLFPTGKQTIRHLALFSLWETPPRPPWGHEPPLPRGNPQTRHQPRHLPSLHRFQPPPALFRKLPPTSPPHIKRAHLHIPHPRFRHRRNPPLRVLPPFPKTHPRHLPRHHPSSSNSKTTPASKSPSSVKPSAPAPKNGTRNLVRSPKPNSPTLPETSSATPSIPPSLIPSFPPLPLSGNHRLPPKSPPPSL